MKINDLLEKMNSKVIFSKPSSSLVYFIEDLNSINQEELEKLGVYAVSDGLELIDFKVDGFFNISHMYGVESWVPREFVSLEDFNHHYDYFNSRVTYYGKMVKWFDLFVDRSKYANAKVYLDVNGVTIKGENCYPGYRAILNGIEYEVVDRILLKERINSGADLTKLCTSLVSDMSGLFQPDIPDDSDSTTIFKYSLNQFNQPIGNWDVSNVTNMSGMFMDSIFNQPIGNWDVSNVSDMSVMFKGAKFNQPIGNWDVSNVSNMSEMFNGSIFNQPIGNWDVSNVTKMYCMFMDSIFNQPIGDWGVSNVTDMSQMFFRSKFNQTIGNWDVSNVTDMSHMFCISKFNQPIGDWDVSNVSDMEDMFLKSEFNQSIDNWGLNDMTKE